MKRCLQKMAHRSLAGALARWLQRMEDVREAAHALAKAEKFVKGLLN